MNIRDYEFHVGDEVITTEGERGKIVTICTCDRCKERGFYEPFWIEDKYNNYERCIDKFTAEIGFNGYYKIGNYRFNDFDKAEVYQNLAYCENSLRKYKRQLKVIEEMESKERIKDFK